MWHRIARTAVVILAVVAGARIMAEEKKAQADKRFDHMQYIAEKLGLNEQQQAQLRKIHAEFEAKTDPLLAQIWATHHEECDAMKKALTDDQRNRLPQAIRAEVNKELDKVAARLELMANQKTRFEKVRDEYHGKFEQLAHAKGENWGKEFHALRHEAMAAVCQFLTPEQRAKLPGVMREEFRIWHDPEARRAHLRSIADGLGLNEEQREREQKIMTEFNSKLDKEAGQLKVLFQDEREAMGKVLTPDQRTKWMEMTKNWGFKFGQTERREKN